MLIKEYENEFGKIKLVYRKRFVFFGKDEYYVSGHYDWGGDNNKISIRYSDFQIAMDSFKALKSLMEMRQY